MKTRAEAQQPKLQLLAIGVVVVLFWALTASAVSSRAHLVMGYGTYAGPPSLLEPLMSSLAGCWFVGGTAVAFLALLNLAVARAQTARIKFALISMAVAALPSVMLLARLSLKNSLPPLYWEPLWLSAWTGVSFALLIKHLDCKDALPDSGVPDGKLSYRYSHLAAVLISLMIAVWWYCQSAWYQSHYLLGFNDFGHFIQRVANTGAGRGFLLETPVLPPFWDHFNPGLLLLVPLWKLVPDVHGVFALQALCLAGSGWLIWGISRQSGFSGLASLLWSCAWLAQPSLGQMNLAYTYGWHPVSLAIPAMLAALLALLHGRKHLAWVAALLACSMEEGIIVIVCLFSAVAALHCYLRAPEDRSQQSAGTRRRVLQLSATTWLAASILSAVGFLIVYRASGLAEFQTGRFVALGNTPLEILLSPFQRPEAFWSELLKPSKAAFVLSLLLPCYALALVQGWRWLLAAVIPLAVLVIWDHRPAACLGFQYAAGLLPIFWFAAIWGSRNAAATSSGMGALATGLVLSLFVGQLPYSSPAIVDVVAGTYGPDGIESRAPSSAAGEWLNAQVAVIRGDGSEVLATGRIAAHLVGNRDVETVGQYLQRRSQLAELPDRKGEPIRHYAWIILDRRELFQQSVEDTDKVEAEALQSGFVQAARMEEIIVLRRTSPSPDGR